METQLTTGSPGDNIPLDYLAENFNNIIHFYVLMGSW